MFKRTIRLLNENEQQQQKIIDKFTPNYHLADRIKIYNVKAEYLPRQKVNPFRKRPLRVIYDHNDFNSFVMPSRRAAVFPRIIYINTRLVYGRAFRS
jgi:CRISPR/Cas system-associated protein Cas5 (RAMP superfamily)